jgi:hypothetical protein
VGALAELLLWFPNKALNPLLGDGIDLGFAAQPMFVPKHYGSGADEPARWDAAVVGDDGIERATFRL